MSVSRALLALTVVGLSSSSLAVRGAEASKEQRWEGTLKISPAAQIRLVFHVKHGPNGTLKATMDSPDQGAEDIAVDTVVRDKTTLSFELKKLGAKFEGKLNAKGNEAVGTFAQSGANFPLTLKAVDVPVAGVKPAGNEQVWEGKLRAGGLFSLRLVLHVVKDKAGAFTATLDSPDQGAKGLKVDSIVLDKTKLTFSMKTIAAEFDGELKNDGTEAAGTWTQGGVSRSLTFKKTDKATEVRRPQTPKPPFPYKSDEVTYKNEAGGVTLAGTLTVPDGPGPFPAVLLISGSGAQDRDESLLGHKPFAVLADALTRRGVAVLRVDDRGVGGSTGKTSESTSEDFADDALAGVAFLKSRPKINPKAIGLIGHSEGGLVAPMAATRSNDVAFIVLMAGTGLPGEEILYLQGRLIAEAMGAQKDALDKQRAFQGRLFQIIKTEPDAKKAATKLREAAKDAVNALPDGQKKDAGDVDALIKSQLAMVESPWFRYFLTYDPRPTLAKVRCPVLALVGEKDLQVPPKENLAAIENTLKNAGNRRVTVKELPGLNHLFQTCKTGNVTEYAEIEETIAPAALTQIGDWVLDQVKGR